MTAIRTGPDVFESTSRTLGLLAVSSEPLPRRALDLLAALRAVVPYDGAWIAGVGRHHDLGEVLASLGLDGTGVGVACAPLTVELRVPDDRGVGHLHLVFTDPWLPTPWMRHVIESVAPVLALGVDPVPSVMSTARMVPGATAGVLLRDDGSDENLPGLGHDPLLDPGSAILTLARHRLAEGRVHSSFLWPRDPPTTACHARITVLVAPADLPRSLVGAVLVSPVHDVKGLTPRELEVLGLIVEGSSNRMIARALALAPRTAATHVENILCKLEASTRTSAAVDCERTGLYVPRAESPSEPAHRGR